MVLVKGGLAFDKARNDTFDQRAQMSALSRIHIASCLTKNSSKSHCFSGYYFSFLFQLYLSGSGNSILSIEDSDKRLLCR